MAMSSSVHPVSRNRREENEMSRPFILQDGSESPAYSWDEHGLLRHWREDYPCPTCTCWFIHPSDVCSHVQSWHRPSGIYYGYPFTARDFTPSEPRKGKQPLAAGRSHSRWVVVACGHSSLAGAPSVSARIEQLRLSPAGPASGHPP